tara:strand:+ start:75 stop:470 length:396 start_codon:yes stop_codon:yes gene_type:complete
MEITKYNSKEETGKDILQKNSFFNDLVKLMKNTEFKEFYNKYFHDWTDIQTMIFYMKLYSTIEYEYNRRFNNNISDELMTYTLHSVMCNKETRKVAMKLFRDFKELVHSNTYDFRTLIQFNDDTNNLLIKN